MIGGDVRMTWPMRDFDLPSQLAMYAATAGCLLLAFGVIGGVVLLVKSLFRRGRYHQSSRP
jgi:hypothetical protein